MVKNKKLFPKSNDTTLKARLESYANKDSDYWSFRGKAVREHAHAYFQYPAMMVPQMQSELIRVIREVVPCIKTVFDPFVGSGTTMTESMLQGLNFAGQDINPLAFLLCKVKSGPFFSSAIENKAELLIKRTNRYFGLQIEVNFPGLTKWFRDDIAIALSQIKRAIQKEPSKWARRFFWIALAETVRLTSNCRTSTFKLHIRPEEEITKSDISAKQVFENILIRNIERLLEIQTHLDRKGLLNKGYYRGDVSLSLRDTSSSIKQGKDEKGYDLLVTSPPYGDNTTTVPYGQHSYLPLQWITTNDIKSGLGRSHLATTHEIDRRSLGGSRKNAFERAKDLELVSPTFQRIMCSLKNEPSDRRSRVAAFCADLESALTQIIQAMKQKAYMIWTLGNRCIANRKIPIDEIVSELLVTKGAKRITKLQRTIPKKRAARKNNTTTTIASESILVMRKLN